MSTLSAPHDTPPTTFDDPVRIGWLEKLGWVVLGFLPAWCLLGVVGLASAAIVHAGASGGCGGG